MALGDLDLNKKVQQIDLFLAKPDTNRTIIAKITHAYNKNNKLILSKINELNFTVPYQIDMNHVLIRTPYIDNIKEKYLVKALIGTSNEWYIITKITKVMSSDKDELQVQCMSLGYELKYKLLRNYKVTSYNCTQVLNEILTDTSWTVGYIDPDLDLLYRSFDVSSKSKLDMVLQVAETFNNAIATYDTELRKVNMYKPESIGQDKGFRIMYGQYLQGLNNESNLDEICTRLKPSGKDGLTIQLANPTGSVEIDDFSYFLQPFQRDSNRNVLKSSDYLSDSLSHAILDYNAKLLTKQPTTSYAETGTTATNINITNHGLVTGDYISNGSRGNVYSKVTVVDANNFTVTTITGQTIGDAISKYKDGTFGKLMYQLQDNQVLLTQKQDEMSSLQLQKSQILDTLYVQQQSNTLTNFNYTYNGTLTTNAATLINTNKYAVLMKVSSTTNLNVTLNGTSKTLTANTWTLLGKLTNTTVASVVVNGTATNVDVQIVVVKITDAEYNATAYATNVSQTPFTAPTLSQTANTSSTLPIGTYYVQYTWVNSLGESNPSPESVFTVDSGNQLTVTLPTFPTGVTSANIYISTAVTVETNQGSTITTAYNQSIPLVVGSAKPIQDIVDKYSIDNKLAQITSKQTEIDNVNTAISNINSQISTMNNDLSYTNVANFTTEQYQELMPFIIEQEWTDENYIDHIDLYNATVKKMQTINVPQLIIKTDIVNFLACVTEQRNWDKLVLGDKVTVQYDKLKVDVQAQITEIETNFEEAKINLTITSNSRFESDERKFYKSLYKSIQTTTDLTNKKHYWDNLLLNFDTRNDRKTTIPADPILANDGTAIDHITNTDGSVDISFDWTFNPNYSSDDKYDIDGFIISIYSSDQNSSYTFGATVTKEQVFVVDKSKRAFILHGVPADRYYTFGIQAYRDVDNDVAPDGVLKSNIVKSTFSGENPYLPSATVSFQGDVAGTINSVASGTVSQSALNFNSRNDRISTTPANPTIANDGTSIDHIINTDGSADISFEWSFTGTGDTYDIDGFVVYVYSSSGNSVYSFGTTPANEQSYFVDKDKRAFILYGVPANNFYTFGIQAYRSVDNDINSTGFLKSAIIKPSLTAENPYQPSTSVAFGGDITGTVNGVSASTLTTQAYNGDTAKGILDTNKSTWDTTATNFNNRNDRNNVTPANSIVLTDTTAVDHTINTDGSADISFEWVYSGTGNAYDIDGFIIYVYQSSSSFAYTFGTTPASEQVFYVSSEKRSFILYGVAANKYYTFGVQAYRIVDQDINSSGILKSDIVKPSITEENPYRPSSSVTFNGDITGTIGGIAYDSVSKTPATVIVADGSTSNNTKRADYVVPANATNAQVAINNAINSISSNGGKVVLMDGTYTISGQITTPSNITIEGQGNQTIIKLANNSVGASGTWLYMFTNSDPTNGNTNIQIKNLSIQGNSINQTNTGSSIGIYTAGACSNVVIDNVRINSVKGRGIHLTNITNGIITNNTVTNCTADGIVVQGSYNTISSNISNNNSTGVEILYVDISTGIYGNVASNNICNNSSSYGISLLSNGGGNNSITGNTIKGCVYDGIYVYYSNKNTISGNTSSQNSDRGIHIYNSNYNTITANTFSENNKEGLIIEQNSAHNNINGNTITANSQQANNTYDNLIITGNASYNNVQSNIFRKGTLTNQPRYGVNIASLCTGNIITNNDLYTAGATATISDSGTGTITASGNRLA
jgi:phage minor structural protein